jgi:hypothetical protein
MTDYRFDAQLALAANSVSVRTVMKAHVEGRLRLRPAFQRNLVWNKAQKSYLIDSILRNLPIPELYIQVGDAPGANDDLMVVVDGQQRISTCIEFVTDQLRLTGEDLAPDWLGRTFSELPPELQGRFSRYKLVVRELPDLEEPAIREIFRRLNRVVEPLLPQELRHAAYSGSFIELIERVAAHPVLQELRVFSAKDYRRRGNDELISEITYAHIQRAFPNKKDGLDEAFRSYAIQGFSDDTARDLRRRFGRVFELLETVSEAVRYSRFRNKSDFYSLVVYLLGRAESLPLTEEGKAEFIRRMMHLSARLSEFRRAALNGEEQEANSAEDTLLLKYMRAVERAASDRLSRVRRNDVLEEWFGPALALGRPSELTSSDEDWLAQLESSEQESEAEVEAERRQLGQVLLKDI